MSNKPFFPRLTSKFTNTPNLFFDKVVPEADTKNEIRAVAFVVRKTLGWQKKFDCVSRSQFTSEARISNGQLTKTLRSCIEKGWLLCFREGEPGKETSYYFLNDPLNSKLVRGLEKGLFSISDLKYKNEEGLIRLLNEHGLKYDPEQDSDPDTTVDTDRTSSSKDISNNTTTAAINQESMDPAPPIEATTEHGDTRDSDLIEPVGEVQPPPYGARTPTAPVPLRCPEGNPYGNRTPTPTAAVPTKESILNKNTNKQQHRESSKPGSNLESNVIDNNPDENVVVANNQFSGNDSDQQSKTSVAAVQQLAVRVIGKRLTATAAEILAQYDLDYIGKKMKLAKGKELTNLDGWLIKHCRSNWNDQPHEGKGLTDEKQSHRRNIPKIDPKTGMVVCGIN